MGTVVQYKREGGWHRYLAADCLLRTGQDCTACENCRSWKGLDKDHQQRVLEQGKGGGRGETHHSSQEGKQTSAWWVHCTRSAAS